MVDRPFGFLLLTVAAVCILYNAAHTLSYDSSYVPAPLYGHLLDALLGATALLAAEALWCMRRWVFRAVLAMAVSLELWLLAPNLDDSQAIAVTFLVSLTIMIPILLYVSHTASKLFRSTP